jgi:hypothetical protein
MTPFDPSQIQWISGASWSATSAEEAVHAEKELQREMCPGHVLFDRPITAVGCRRGCDDFLFYLGETAPRFAVVHLTYRKETRSEWPWTTLFDSLDAWIERCLIPDSED